MESDSTTIRYSALRNDAYCRKQGDSIGGVVEVVLRNVPSGLGGPVFDKLEADLAKACMSIPAAKGFEVSLYLITDYRTFNNLQ